jgi:DNA polymerase I-like protein with 3'-5' exonuclease and polymerase domains
MEQRNVLLKLNDRRDNFVFSSLSKYFNVSIYSPKDAKTAPSSGDYGATVSTLPNDPDCHFRVCSQAALGFDHARFLEYLMLPHKLTAFFEKKEDLNIETCLSPEEVIAKLKDYVENPPKFISYDCETQGLSPHLGELLIISFSSDRDSTGYWFPLKIQNSFPYKKIEFPEFLGREPSFSELIEIKYLFNLAISNTISVGHNIKYDLRWLIYHGFLKDVTSYKFSDTMIMSFFLYSKQTRLKLKSLVPTIFGIEDWSKEVDDIIEAVPPASGRCYSKIPTGILGKYAGMDSFYTKKLYELLIKFQRDCPAISIVMDAIPVFAEIELIGIHVDPVKLKTLRREYEARVIEAKDEISQLPKIIKYNEDRLNILIKQNDLKKRKRSLDSLRKGSEFNLNSSKQKGDIIYEVYKFPVVKTTKKGAKSSDKDTLNSLVKAGGLETEATDFLKTMLSYSENNKILSTYLNGFLEPINNFYHPDFNLIGTRTGRISAGYHTIPSKNSDIKSLFDSRFGSEGFIVSIDYSQLELAVLGFLSEEGEIIKTFEAGKDMHTKTAASALGVPEDQVTDTQRSVGKKINFSIVYRTTPEGLAESLKISVVEASAMIHRVEAMFPKLTHWIREQESLVVKTPWLISKSGRFIPIPETFSNKEFIRTKAKREAVNYQAQGFGSDIVLASLINFYKSIKGKKIKLIGTVHDSIQFDVHHSDLLFLLTNLKEGFEIYPREYFNAYIPLRVDVEIGLNLGESCSMIFNKNTGEFKLDGDHLVSVLGRLDKFFSTKDGRLCEI